MLNKQIGFIGAGQMARALASGFVAAELVNSSNVSFSDPSTKSLEQTAQQIPGSIKCSSNTELINNCDIVFVAVKPQYLADVAAEVSNEFNDQHLLVSVVAGTTLNQLEHLFSTARCIRVMPNTPSLIRQGASGIAAGPDATDDDVQTIVQLMNAVGIAFELNESQIDAVTGLSGSGPAFVFTFIEALSDGGVKMGLPRDVATKLAVQTVRGAAELVQQTELHPAVLRDQVTSPGGTTICGLHELEKGCMHGTVVSAVEAAANKAKQLGEK